MLHPRTKWRQSSRDFAVGDVVLVIQCDTARGHWPLGRIVAVLPGNGGHVRVVDVKSRTICAEASYHWSLSVGVRQLMLYSYVNKILIA